MLLIFLDTETTGCNPEKHRIIEIAFKIIESHSDKLIGCYESIISQPMEIWANADPESSLIHGMDWERTLKGKSEKAVAGEIINDLNFAQIGNKRSVFICQNPSFDRCFFNQLVDPELQTHYNWPYHWLDLASMYWAARTLENQSLPEDVQKNGVSKDKIALHYGIPSEEIPHRALRGVDHLIACYEAIFGEKFH